MKNHLLFGLIIILVGLVILGVSSQNASANFNRQEQDIKQFGRGQLAALTPKPTAPPIIIGDTTPESRVLPPIGSNAWLVIGASVLVLIIIGGVLSAQRKQKH